jgi:hypothetical protein
MQREAIVLQGTSISTDVLLALTSINPCGVGILTATLPRSPSCGLTLNRLNAGARDFKPTRFSTVAAIVDAPQP